MADELMSTIGLDLGKVKRAFQNSHGNRYSLRLSIVILGEGASEPFGAEKLVYFKTVPKRFDV